MKLITVGLLVTLALSVSAAVFVYSGVFNVAADAPHSALVFALMQAVRDRSIAVRIKNIQVPPLEDPNLVAGGAKHYAEMCVDCHLAPAAKESEIRQGLYPRPPILTEHIHASPAEMFWVIKHGIKMSAMPAWGKTHDDQSIWGLVAFLQKLPEITPDQYQALIMSNGEVDYHRHHHEEAAEHGGGEPHHTRHRDDAAAHQDQKR